MGFWDKVGSVNYAGKDPFFGPDAEYLVEIHEVQFFDSQNKNNRGAQFFKIRGRVIKTAFDPEVDRAACEPKLDPATRAGAFAVHMISLSKGDAPLGDIKNFATAVYRGKVLAAEGDVSIVDPSSFGDDEIAPLYSVDQPCAGMVLGLRTTMKVTREKQQPFTQHFWQAREEFTFSLPIQSAIPQPAQGETSKTA
jgi:hypothetical protein